MWLSLTRAAVWTPRPAAISLSSSIRGTPATRTQGNGLGLAMAQKIAALHGGAVTVDSRPGSRQLLYSSFAVNIV